MKKIKVITGVTALWLACLLLFAGCTPNNNTADEAAQAAEATETDTAEAVDYEAVSANYSSNDLTADFDTDNSTVITLNGASATVSGDGATADDSVVTITEAGVYILSGTLTDGQISVDADDDTLVRLILNGVTITSQSGSPIDVKNADKVVITLADGSSNTVSYEETGSDVSAAIYSKDDLTVNGQGRLTVNAYTGEGIASKDDLKIVSGTIDVTSAGDALKGSDSIGIKDGILTLEAGGDGMETTNDKENKGYIDIEGGTIKITASLDGIQAQTGLLISGGDISVTTGGGSANSSTGQDDWGQWQPQDPFNQGNDTGSSDEANDSAKGLKAVSDITVTGGNIDIDSSDDAMHSNGTLSVEDGTISASSGDDGIHADMAIAVSGGNITILQSYEGVESADVSISGGTLHITASDDGINVAGGSDSSSTSGRPGQNDFNAADGTCQLVITGGYISVNAAGDGIDSNGSISMTNGIVLVCGPTDSSNGALDFSSFNMDGGLLIAAGSVGMAQTPGSESTQNVVGIALDNAVSENTLFSIVAEDGTPIVVFSPCKTYQSVVVSSPSLETGSAYTVYTGGSASGDVTDGLYTDNSYTPGDEAASFTVSSTVTTIGSMEQSMGGGHGGKR